MSGFIPENLGRSDGFILLVLKQVGLTNIPNRIDRSRIIKSIREVRWGLYAYARGGLRNCVSDVTAQNEEKIPGVQKRSAEISGNLR